jgi:hypothetical protein
VRLKGRLSEMWGVLDSHLSEYNREGGIAAK